MIYRFTTKVDEDPPDALGFSTCPSVLTLRQTFPARPQTGPAEKETMDPTRFRLIAEDPSGMGGRDVPLVITAFPSASLQDPLPDDVVFNGCDLRVEEAPSPPALAKKKSAGSGSGGTNGSSATPAGKAAVAASGKASKSGANSKGVGKESKSTSSSSPSASSVAKVRQILAPGCINNGFTTVLRGVFNVNCFHYITVSFQCQIFFLCFSCSCTRTLHSLLVASNSVVAQALVCRLVLIELHAAIIDTGSAPSRRMRSYSVQLCRTNA